MTETKAKNSFSKENSLALKGIGILMLMGIHCFGATYRFKGFEVDFSPFTQDQFVDFCAYLKICVAVFAFISGYGLYLSASKKCTEGKATTQWLTERYFKTFSGYWFIYVIFFAITQILINLPAEKYFEDGKFRGVAYTFIDFIGLSDLFDTPSLNGSWWYMTAALLFIVVAPLLCAGEKKFGLIGTSVALIVIPRVILGGDFYGKSNGYSFLVAYLLGAVFAKYGLFDKIENISIKGNKIIANIIFFVFMVVALPVSYLLWHRVPVDKAWEFHYGVAPLLVIIFCQKFIFKIPILNKVLAFFGKHSMNIFLFHTFLRANLLKQFLFGLGTPYRTMAALFFISLAISIVLEFVKKLIKYDLFIDKLSSKIVTVIAKD